MKVFLAKDINTNKKVNIILERDFIKLKNLFLKRIQKIEYKNEYQLKTVYNEFNSIFNLDEVNNNEQRKPTRKKKPTNNRNGNINK